MNVQNVGGSYLSIVENTSTPEKSRNRKLEIQMDEYGVYQMG
jgi:hypothetical protein